MKKQNEREYKQTEAFICQKEKDEFEWVQKNRGQQQNIINQVEQMLSSGSEKSRAEVLERFRDKEFIETFKSQTQIAYMIVMMQIYEKELQNELNHTILDMGNNFKQILSIIQQIKFFLWRIEFTEDSECKEQFIKLVTNKRVSSEMIQFLVSTSACNKVAVLLELTNLFLEKNMLKYAFRMLEYLNELESGNEEILCMLAELCAFVGKRERMEGYLKQITNPGEMTERVRKKYEY